MHSNERSEDTDRSEGKRSGTRTIFVHPSASSDCSELRRRQNPPALPLFAKWHTRCSVYPSMPEERSRYKSMHILIVDQNVTRAPVLEDGVREAGYGKVTIVRDVQNLMRRIVDMDPGAILISLENANRDVLEQVFTVARSARRPVALFVDRSDMDMIEAAIEAGIGAYVVDGLKKERVEATLHIAVSRFNALRKLRDDLDRARAEIDERKVVEQAKGILMKERGLSEAVAYGLLRKAAMNENRRVAEVARSVLTAARLLK